MKILPLALAASLLTTTIVEAVPLLINSGGTSSALPTGVDFEWGYRFTPTVDMYVSALGVYDFLEDGLAESHTVSLYSSTLSLITSAEIAAGVHSLTSEFAFADLGAVTQLSANVSYVLAASSGTGLDWFRINTPPNSPVFSDALAVSAFVRNAQTTFSAGPPGSSFVGPNLIYSTTAPSVPDSGSTLVLFGSTFASMVWCARKRRRVRATAHSDLA